MLAAGDLNGDGSKERYRGGTDPRSAHAFCVLISGAGYCTKMAAKRWNNGTELAFATASDNGWIPGCEPLNRTVFHP
jgi:hypothetical protein